ncbi:MAG: nicotinamide mononucleotide transporter [Clostridia bacterium]|nr:nicotinamide mononucleotide transporter [Clostridia bacterium]
MEKVLGKWKWYEILFLSIGEAAIVVSFIFAADKNWLSLITSMIGVFIVMGTAKGLVIAPFVNIVFNILYSIVSISQKYYGEAIIYIFMMMPIAIFTIVQWIRNKNPERKEEVLVGGIKKIEYPIIAGATVVLTVAFYFLLKALHTNELVVSTISLVTSVVASYLLIRRSSYYAIGFILNDIVLIVLWGLASSKDISLLPQAICFAAFLLNDAYGFVRWKMEERKQTKNLKN